MDRTDEITLKEIREPYKIFKCPETGIWHKGTYIGTLVQRYIQNKLSLYVLKFLESFIKRASTCEIILRGASRDVNYVSAITSVRQVVVGGDGDCRLYRCRASGLRHALPDFYVYSELTQKLYNYSKFKKKSQFIIFVRRP